ncbi:sigma-70 family RNA polymerase sigma factor [uncultured Sphingomonas sp.]|uniref:RNA polymerase sigma factor n=1 Tax=uncultured Sphingomonas sp. TaxID=158754 RepID=UPI00261C3DC8|nr:sigma-70 family RNA polymerase sigma factor [uncultured Sphingomonas sp.]
MAEPTLVSAYGEQRAMLLRLLTARLGSAADAEDALQDLWFRIVSGPVTRVDNPAAYLMRMAGNLATDRRIAARRRALLETHWAESGDSALDLPSPERAALARDALYRADMVIAAMPERMRTAYRLFRMDHLPQREIADRLGISLSAVEKLLQRAYRRLHAMADEGGDD